MTMGYGFRSGRWGTGHLGLPLLPLLTFMPLLLPLLLPLLPLLTFMHQLPTLLLLLLLLLLLP